MKKSKFLSAILAAALGFSAAAFSACDFLPSEPSTGGSVVDTPVENQTHKDFLIENFTRRWNEIVSADEENDPKKLTSEHYAQYSSLMSELCAVEWDEASSKENDEQLEKLDEIQLRFNKFIDEASRLVRGGVYVTFEIVPCEYEADDNVQYGAIEYWSKTPVSYQEIVESRYVKNSVIRRTYWDRYTSTIDGRSISSDYVFSESEHVVCYENEPDFFLTIKNVNLSGTTDERVEACWGEFTFWQWYVGAEGNGYNRHNYQRDMTMRPMTCNGALMQPDDVINSSRTLIATEQDVTPYQIDVVVEIQDETREIGEAYLYFPHTFYEAAIYDAYLYDDHVQGEIKEEELYYYFDWFDVYFNGEKIENHEIKEYEIAESGTVTLKGRDKYVVTFEVDAQLPDGATRSYGPYTVEVKTEELYGAVKAEIILEEFLREELGGEEYEEVFLSNNLTFYHNDDVMDIIDHSCKIVAKQYVPTGGGESDDDGQTGGESDQNEALIRFREEEERIARDWAELSEAMDTSLFEEYFNKVNVDFQYGSDGGEVTEEGVDALLENIYKNYDLLVSYVHFYNELKNDWKSVCENNPVPENYVQRGDDLLLTLRNLDLPSENGEGEMECKRNEYNDLRAEALSAASHNDQTDEDDSSSGENDQTDDEVVIAPPEGFPSELNVIDGKVYTDEDVYVGAMFDGKILNEETNETVGAYLCVLDENGQFYYLITLTIGELSYDYEA